MQEAAGKAILGTLVTRPDVALFLGMTTSKLNFLLYGLTPTDRYRSFEIKKRSGGVRTIQAPKLPLKKAQRKISELLESQYHPRKCVFGYVKGKNIIQNADCHDAPRWLLRVDLADFFPSIHFGRVLGMLLKPPFSLPKEAATTIAQLCCFEGRLPQGSPASPVISNLLCRGLDHELLKLANSKGCKYTRYCDDLVFSGRRRLPSALARNHTVEGAGSGPALGALLNSAIERAGFNVNPAKIQLRFKGGRQMVTGLVVNVVSNIPKKFIRDIRMILHVWRKFDIDAATSWYLTKYDKKNRQPCKDNPQLTDILRGKIQYLGSVRGWTNSTYTTLANKLAKLDPNFRPTTKPDIRPKPTLSLHAFVEGITDKVHIDTALHSMNAKGTFTHLRLDIQSKSIRGVGDLLARCERLSESPQHVPTVFIADSDDKSVVSKMRGDDGGVRDWTNNVFSIVLPTPPHRADEERLCIEMLYTDPDFRREDGQKRRLFRTSEFDLKSGKHKSEGFYWKHPSSKDVKLIVDTEVIEWDTGENRLLTKVAFSELIRKHRSSVNFQGFEPLFRDLLKIQTLLKHG